MCRLRVGFCSIVVVPGWALSVLAYASLWWETSAAIGLGWSYNFTRSAKHAGRDSKVFCADPEIFKLAFLHCKVVGNCERFASEILTH